MFRSFITVSFLTACLLVAFTLTGTALAASTFVGSPSDVARVLNSSSDSSSVTSIALTTPYTDDVYVAGPRVSVQERVNGDVIVFGGVVTIDGDVQGSVIALGGIVTINGNVGRTVRVLGGIVTINGNVGHDVVTMSGNLTIARSAAVGGSVHARGDVLTVSGNVGEDAWLRGEAVQILGWVNGTVTADARKSLIISPSAKIKGNLLYYSDHVVTIPDAVVMGKSERQASSFAGGRYLVLGFLALGSIAYRVWLFVALSLLSLVLIFVAPLEFEKMHTSVTEHFPRHLGYGFLYGVAGAVLSLLLIVSLIGLPIGAIIAALMAIVWLGALIYSGYMVGVLILKPTAPTRWRVFGCAVLGLFVFHLVALIPVVGLIVTFILTLANFGALFERRHAMYRMLREKKAL